MDSSHSGNENATIMLGIFIGIVSYFAEHPVLLENTIGLLKVAVYGFVGGMCSYKGKKFLEKRNGMKNTTNHDSEN